MAKGDDIQENLIDFAVMINFAISYQQVVNN